MEKKFEPKKIVVDVQVYDLDRAIGFYRDVLELPLLHRADDWGSFEVGGAEIHLYLHGGVEYGIEFFVHDIYESVDYLKSKGLVFFVEPTQANCLGTESNEIMLFPWGKTALFKDSEGNQLALIEERQL